MTGARHDRDGSMIGTLHLLRFVPGDSVVHRAGSRSKILALTMLIFALSFDPEWSSVAVIWTFATLVFVGARLPAGALPRPPRALRWAMGVALVLGLLAGGEPTISFGGGSIDVGGLLFQLRFFGVTLGLLALALLVGWTTPLGQLPEAAAWMLRPLRWLRLPIDDVVAGLTLAVRVLPLMAEELSTATALWSSRPTKSKRALVDVVDLAATATTSATRRATELGEAMSSRGPVVVPVRSSAWCRSDLMVLAVASTSVAVIIVI